MEKIDGLSFFDYRSGRIVAVSHEEIYEFFKLRNKLIDANWDIELEYVKPFSNNASIY